MDPFHYITDDCLSSDSLWLLIRHGEKVQPPKENPFVDVPLTQKGIEEATRFGKLLKNKFPNEIKGVHSSPKRRCVETSEAILKGIGDLEGFETSTLLGNPGPYVIDSKVAGQSYLKIRDENIVKIQVEGTQIDGFRDVMEGSKLLLEYVLTRKPNPGMHIFVTHDVIIAAFLGSVIGYVVDEPEWIKYLQGICIYIDDKKVYMDTIEGKIDITKNAVTFLSLEGGNE